ncbi:A24 family peptidase [Pseudooctadecabacter jejudonensis]|uniref:Type IV leader peptidase family protein n=1 Tax=Pseudooctadecabacter jejudonensis TaxID=1391910 RepID=A0A1Y5T171_9RHOB|nr:prepilin peptidase [Pseudooctadecabacter jejudonensis]SLN49732.1 Type IV leader peptidase family protein [Pseudooctadecabacter jejudonensis]
MFQLPPVDVTVAQSIAFLIFVAPLCIYVAWNDLRAMKIPTWSTDALAIIFVVVGIFVMPFSDYLWRYAHFFVVLLLAIIANMIGMMGAGDSKFLASAAPFVALGDVTLVLYLLGAGMVAGLVVHRIAKAIPPIRNLVPHWESWGEKRRFPMGFPMAAVLIVYLARPLF